MYDKIKDICNKQINHANIQIKYKRDIEYHKGIIDANILILKQLTINEEYIKNKNKIDPYNLLKKAYKIK